MVPSPPTRPPGRVDDRDDGRLDDAIAAALAVLDGRPPVDPSSAPARRVVAVLDAIRAASTTGR